MSALTNKPKAIWWAVVCVFYAIDFAYYLRHLDRPKDYIPIILTGICIIASAVLVRSELSDKRSALKRR